METYSVTWEFEAQFRIVQKWGQRSDVKSHESLEVMNVLGPMMRQMNFKITHEGSEIRV